jgi:heme/copper-type cytochrome/quinol oxidase subunit 3
MSVIDEHSSHDHHGHYAEGGNHHDTPRAKHRKEHMLVWMLIGGDMVFTALMIFAWFYLKALNVEGMWRGAACTPNFNSALNQSCTDGIGNAIKHIVPTAAPLHTFAIALLAIVGAGLLWFAEVQARQGASGKATTPLLGLGSLAILGALVWQIYQFQVLPFTTVQGAYASSFEYIMGSNVFHLTLVLILTVGLLIRGSKGLHDNGRWYQIHLSRLFASWVALSITLLACMVTFFN